MHDTTSKPAPLGVPGEMRKLNADSQATVAELREFLGQMRSRSPQEVLGLLAESELLRCVLGSTVVFAVGMILLTLGPFLLGSGTPEKKAVAAPVAAPSNANSGEPAAAPTQPDSDDPRANAGKAVQAMGIDETKDADAAANPLENSLDDILKDIK